VQKRILDLPGVLELLRKSGLEFTCTIAGRGKYEETLKERLDHSGLAGAVRFDGWLDTRRLYDDFYPSLDVFLSFAEYEGVPIAPREAMAHGVVTVMANYAGCRDEGFFRDQRNCLLFAPGDVEACANAVIRLAEDHELWRTLSDGAVLSNTGVYDGDGALDAWADGLRRAISGPPAIGPRIQPRAPGAGRLDRVLGPSLAETARDLLGRRFPHEDGGGEWPHTGGLGDVDMLRKIELYGRAAS